MKYCTYDVDWRDIGEYPFTLLATRLSANLEVISCAKHSKLIKELHEEGIRELMERQLSKRELKELEIDQKKKIIHAEHEFRQEKEKTLHEFFKDAQELPKRNTSIINALEDGYRQAEVARYLHLSLTAISNVFRGVK